MNIEQLKATSPQKSLHLCNAHLFIDHPREKLLNTDDGTHLKRASD
ncbi:MAG: hypothetical protein ACJAUA_000322 [Zhongshania aliphaticivorans]|jgi:hypothetical protein